jgi:hypothetical protein
VARDVAPAISREGNAEAVITTGGLSGVGVAMGMIPWAQGESRFGHNDAIGATEETIWSQGGRYTWPTVADNWTVESTDAADNTAGAGARSFFLQGLNENWDLVNEIVLLDGLTPVATQNKYIRVCCGYVVVGGTEDGSVGDILVKNNGDVVAKADAGHNRIEMAIFSIPAGKTGYVTYGKASTGKGKDATLNFYVRPFGGVFQSVHVAYIYENSYEYPYHFPGAIPEKSDLEVRASSPSAGVELSAAFEVILIDNK